MQIYLVATLGSVVILVAAAAFVWMQRAPLHAAGPPRHLVWLIPAAFLLAMVIAGHVAIRLDGVPYNVKELFESRPTVSLLLLGIVLLGSAGMIHAAARAWQRWPYCFAALAIPGAWLCGLAVFLVLAAAVPTESLDDVVGAPVLGIGAALERSLRFTGLFAGPLAAWTLGVRIARGNYSRGFWVGLAAVFAVLLASYVVVVPLADTDNLVELLRNGGRSPAVLGLPLALMLLGLTSGMTARAIEAALERTFRLLIPAAVVLVCGVPVAWQLFVVSTNPRLEKYGQVFSARQFLFSPDREHYLGDGPIFFRFALAYLLAVGVFAAGILAARLAERAWCSRDRK